MSRKVTLFPSVAISRGFHFNLPAIVVLTVFRSIGGVFTSHCCLQWSCRFSLAPFLAAAYRTVAKRLVLPNVGAGESEIAKSTNACVAYTRLVPALPVVVWNLRHVELPPEALVPPSESRKFGRILRDVLTQLIARKSRWPILLACRGVDAKSSMSASPLHALGNNR